MNLGFEEHQTKIIMDDNCHHKHSYVIITVGTINFCNDIVLHLKLLLCCMKTQLP